MLGASELKLAFHPCSTGPLLPKRMVAPAAQLLMKALRHPGVRGLKLAAGNAGGAAPDSQPGHRKRPGEQRRIDGKGRDKSGELDIMIAVLKAAASGQAAVELASSPPVQASIVSD